MPGEPYDGRVYIADTSAWARAHEAALAPDWTEALRNRQIATCPITVLELLYSTRDAAEFDNLGADLAQLHDVPLSRTVTHAATRAFGRLAHAGPFHHRSVRLPDLLIAAAAAEAALGVLHYDAHFDTLATVLEFESRWIAPAGSIS